LITPIQDVHEEYDAPQLVEIAYSQADKLTVAAAFIHVI